MKDLQQYVLNKHKNSEFTLYHIKGKKWGCAINIQNRLSQQGYDISDTHEIKKVIGIINASNLEEKLNTDYGYPYNSSQSYFHIMCLRTKGGFFNVNSMLKKRDIKSICQGSNNHKAKITEDIVKEIKKEFYDNKPYHGQVKDISKKFNVAYNTVSKIKNNISWTHVK